MDMFFWPSMHCQAGLIFDQLCPNSALDDGIADQVLRLIAGFLAASAFAFTLGRPPTCCHVVLSAVNVCISRKLYQQGIPSATCAGVAAAL